jgi:hypothetical protein
MKKENIPQGDFVTLLHLECESKKVVGGRIKGFVLQIGVERSVRRRDVALLECCEAKTEFRLRPHELIKQVEYSICGEDK